jgi:hypothetical protein
VTCNFVGNECNSGETFLLHLQCRITKPEFLVSWLILRPWRWRHLFSWNFGGLVLNYMVLLYRILCSTQSLVCPCYSVCFLQWIVFVFFGWLIEVEVTLRLTVSRSVCLGIEHPCGTRDQIFLPVRMLLSEVCGLVSVGRPLWREDGSAICSVITEWSESLRTRNHTLLSHLRFPQPGGPGSRIYPPGTGWCSYTPGHWISWRMGPVVHLTPSK